MLKPNFARQLQLLVVSLALMLSGCVSSHVLPEGQPFAYLDISDQHWLFTCTPGAKDPLLLEPEPHRADYPRNTHRDVHRYVRVPAGQRITIGTFFDWPTENELSVGSSKFCYPTLSFLPVAGERYVIDFNAEGYQCAVSLAREDASTKTGLAPEPSVMRPGCSIADPF